MERRFRDRERYIGRNPAKREPKHRILVVCEGKVTEPEYFKALQHEFRNRLVHVEIDKQAGVPLTVVTRAIDLNRQADEAANRNEDDNLRYNDVWCVFDVDEHPNLAEALELAGKSRVQVALSNPCIELWALREEMRTQHVLIRGGMTARGAPYSRHAARNHPYRRRAVQRVRRLRAGLRGRGTADHRRQGSPRQRSAV
jgi:hypothetical protein